MAGDKTLELEIRTIEHTQGGRSRPSSGHGRGARTCRPATGAGTSDARCPMAETPAADAATRNRCAGRRGCHRAPHAVASATGDPCWRGRASAARPPPTQHRSRRLRRAGSRAQARRGWRASTSAIRGSVRHSPQRPRCPPLTQSPTCSPRYETGS